MASKIKYTEQELIQLIREKNENAFSYLYTNYSKALYGIIYKIVNNETESEDILQNIFVKIWNHFASYDPSKSRLYTWMLNIARNAAIDYMRSATNINNNKIHSSDNIVYEIDKHHNQSSNYDYIGLKTEVDKLKTEHRQLIDLVYYEGFTQEEISKELKMPLGTVKTKVRQAITILRKNITE